MSPTNQKFILPYWMRQIVPHWSEYLTCLLGGGLLDCNAVCILGLNWNTLAKLSSLKKLDSTFLMSVSLVLSTKGSWAYYNIQASYFACETKLKTWVWLSSAPACFTGSYLMVMIPKIWILTKIIGKLHIPGLTNKNEAPCYVAVY